MAIFVGIETTGKEKHVAILVDKSGRDFRINAKSLKTRIKNMTRANMDAKEEKAALRALEEVSE